MNDGTLNQRQLIFQLFSQLFPDQPLRADEVNVVMTLTGVYWILPDLAERRSRRS